MAEPIENLRKARLEKLEQLQKNGVPGFPAWIDNNWEMAGRLMAIRGHGKLIFADLVNASGKKQISFKNDKLPDKWSLIELLDIGDFIAIKGEDYTTQAGEPTIDVSDLTLLTKSIRPLPSSWFGFSDVEERYRQRYVDLLMNPEVKKVFTIRTEVIKLLRRKLDEVGFVEVETPVLQPLYGGATARPFITHHNSLDTDFYLRISDELYLKRLIVGGFEKVYEIGKDFRNEGMDRNHSPEFTMLEFYWAYANYEDLMKFTEEMLSEVVKEVSGSYEVIYQDKKYNFEPPWERMTLRDLILRDTGIDIDINNTFEKLLKASKDKALEVNLKGVIGFGPLVDEIYKTYSRSNIKGPIFLTDYPFQMLPLAKRKKEDSQKAASFQLLVAGGEWIKAYNELNDPTDQKSRWEEEMKLATQGLEEHQVLDEDYIRALEYGMPPTAGWGMGVDKLVGLLADVANPYREAVLFPAMRPENK